ncbi:MAG: helix-turn-helix domain-containing protein [Flavobacteriales bacterium]
MSNPKIHVTPRCPIRTTAELIGGKWKLLILHQLSSGPMRLTELGDAIPDISEKMLVQELNVMVQSGLVSKQRFNEAPPRVEYAVTDKGEKIGPLLAEMARFAAHYEREDEQSAE